MNNSLYEIASRSEAIHDMALTMLADRKQLCIVDQARLHQLARDLQSISDALEEITAEEETIDDDYPSRYRLDGKEV